MVFVTKLEIGHSTLTYFPDDPFSGELRAFFDPSGFTIGSWNTEGFGFICGDKTWLKDFKAGLRELGFSIKAAQNVAYEESVMQKPNYVSLKVGPNFYKSWARLQEKAKNETSDALV